MKPTSPTDYWQGGIGDIWQISKGGFLLSHLKAPLPILGNDHVPQWKNVNSSLCLDYRCSNIRVALFTPVGSVCRCLIQSVFEVSEIERNQRVLTMFYPQQMLSVIIAGFISVKGKFRYILV